MKKYVSYDRTVPTVNFDSKELELFMMDFMLENVDDKKSVNEYVGLVMLRLGFKSEDKIEIRDVYNNDNNNQLRVFRCVVNDKDYYDIRFMNVGNNKLNTEITLVDYTEETTYECVSLGVSEIGIKIIPVKEEVLFADGVTCTRELSDDKAKFELCYDDYKLELDVVKPKNIELPIYDSNWGYSRYRLDNEMSFRNYLINFFPIITCGDIVSVYKEIVKLSLGDVSKYPEIILKFSYGDKVTDLIHLKNGELERFGVTLLRMDRTLFLNKDGSWLYEINDRDNLFNISMGVTDDKTNYNISISNDSDISMISDIISNDTDTMKRDIGMVKKLVKKTFNSDNSNGSN